jgi:hypothetical protein
MNVTIQNRLVQALYRLLTLRKRFKELFLGKVDFSRTIRLRDSYIS